MNRNIVLEVTIGIVFIILTIVININIKDIENRINNVNIQNDSIIKLYNKLQLADSLKSIKLNKSFYLDRDSVNIDSRGYFRSKYNKQYKIRKD